MPFNPIELSKKMEKIVSKNLERKYYRFRPAKFYGGIATADVCGCNLRCEFCWAWNVISRPERIGKFYSPQDVANNLISIAKKYKFNQIRVSGNEPTINKQHLLNVLGILKDSSLNFILETNGILIGFDESYAKDLSKYKDFIHVRVSFKASNKEEFSKLTGALPEAFELQIGALKNLVKENVPCHPAVMISFSEPASIKNLRDRLETISPNFYDFEEETLVLYGNVKKRLDEAKINYKIQNL